MKNKITLTTFVLLWVSQMMAVDYTINVQSEGCNAVAYTLPSGAEGQIQAMPNTGRHFTQWSDGNTENPRTITVTGDKTYTAQYAPIFITTEVEVEGAYNVEIPDAAKNFALTEQYAYMCGIELEYPVGTNATDYKWMKLNVSGDVSSFRIGHDYRVGWLYQGVDEAYKIIEGETVPSGEQLANADSLTIWIDLGARNMEGADTLHFHQGGYHSEGYNSGKTITINELVLYVENPFLYDGAIQQRGTVSGGGTYDYNSTVTLVATPGNGNKFVKWSDGNTENPRTITVTGDKTYTAQFAKDICTIGVKSSECDLEEYKYIRGHKIVLLANSKIYDFDRWDDGNTDNPRTITVTEDKVYTAIFSESLKLYTVASNSNDNTMGTVEGVGKYAYTTKVTLTAIPTEGCEFVKWSDGEKEAARTIIVGTQNAVYTAIFRKKSLALPISDNTAVSFENGNNFVVEDFWDRHEGFLIDKLVVAAGTTPTNNPAGVWKVFYNTDYLYFLVKINDDNIYTTYSYDGDGVEFYYEGGNSVSAQYPVQYRFYPEYGRVDCNNGSFFYGNNNDNYAVAKCTGGYYVKMRIPLSAIKLYDEGESFRMEMSNNQSDGKIQQNPYTGESGYRQAQLTTWEPYESHFQSTEYYTKVWFKKDQTMCSVKVNSSEEGTVSGSGSYFLGEDITISATPKNGFAFAQWNDGNTDNPRIVKVTGNKTYMAMFKTASYVITANSNDGDMGTVSGSGLYEHNATATLTATPNTGYRFVRWNDGSTLNPRTVTVTSEKTYTATFALKSYTIVAQSGNVTMGTVSGGSTYNHFSTATLTATPNIGYKFVQWSDGSTENPHVVTVTGAHTYTATFEAKIYNVTAQSNDNVKGTVSRGGVYAYNTSVTLIATPNTGYEFIQWNDGNKNNPRVVLVENDVNYTAMFKGIDCRISVFSNDDTWGSVEGEGSYEYGQTVTLTAVAKTGYRFVKWNDGSTENPHSIVVQNDKNYLATFVKDEPQSQNCTLSVTANNVQKGRVTGAGVYQMGTSVIVTAIPNEGHMFVNWSDGNTDNPRTVAMMGDLSLMAMFEVQMYTISIIANNTMMGEVAGMGMYEYNKVATLLATPSAGNHFVQWNDGSTANPHYVKVTGDEMYIATFAAGTMQEESHGATVNNEGVSVTPYETKAEFSWPSITGVASYSLVIWADAQQSKKVCTLTFNAGGQLTNIDFTQSVKPQGESVEGLNFTVTGLKQGTTYAYTLDAKDAEDEVIDTKRGTFTTMGASGIADITAAGINIYTEGRTIIVENATEPISVSDALGRVVGTDDAHIVHTETRKFPVPSSGVYVVKIGNRSASVLVR